MAEIIAAIEGAIADSLGASNLLQSIIGVVQSSMAAAQSTLMESQYLAAIPIIAAEFRGLVSILQGSGEVFIGGLESLEFFIPDLFDGIYTLLTFALSWMMCLFKNISNMQTCLFYYLLETFGQIIYLPFRIVLWLCYVAKLDLYQGEKSFWDKIEQLDRVLMKYIGFHISHYPKNIRQQCYNCKRLKISTLTRHAGPLVNDITNKLPAMLMPGFMRIAKGGEQLMNPFDL
jgi:hypothetical protein